MSRNTKLAILGAVGCLMAVCCLGAGILGFGVLRLGQSVTDPGQGATVGHEIVNYRLPPGYREIGGLNVLGSKYVIIGPEGQQAGGLVIMLIQVASGADPQQVEAQMRSVLAGQFSGSTSNLQKVGDQTVTIKDQRVVLTVYEGSNASSRMRQVVGVFQGNAGPVMIMAMGPSQHFDQQALSAFLSSIR